MSSLPPHHPADDLDDDTFTHDADVAADDSPCAADPSTPLDYWAVSRTPLTSLVFSLPLVLAYEGGVLWLGRGTPRNGADVWLRQLLDACGFGAYFLLPALTVVGLLVWHHVEHDRWQFSPAVLMGMAGECVLWAMVLVGIARLQQQVWPLGLQTVACWPLAAAPGPSADLVDGALARVVGYCGAGLYEEVLFRLLLLPAVAWLLGRLGSGPITAAVWAILITSGLFSLAHYVGPLGDAFELYSFSFRMAAGVFFAVVFLLRGFGIAAGTHALYDLLVGLL
ncbi:MAG: CPBP family intramembrane glutamic endopeptidase [Planctomycetaceae bacterium]